MRFVCSAKWEGRRDLWNRSGFGYMRVMGGEFGIGSEA